MPSENSTATDAARERPRIPDYEIPEGGMIGEGTYGQVWFGLYREDQPRAVKVFKPETLRKDRWRAEYEKLKALDEPPGIVTLYDQGETVDGMPYVAMRLMADSKEGGDEWQGRTLAQRIEGDDLDMKARWRLVFEIADTLAYLHRQGVYHCDVKPSNVLLSAGEEPRAVLCDFGQSIGEGFSPEGATGTFLYASPEQLRRNEAAIQGWDVYSFGVTAYQLLTGKLPRLNQIAEDLKREDEATVVERTVASFSPDSLSFGESMDRELIPLVMVEAVEAERELTVPGEFEEGRKEEFEVLLNCLALDGDRPGRYPGMPQVIEAFEEVARRRMIAAERRKKLVFATLMVFGLVAAAVAGWQWRLAEGSRADAELYGNQAVEAAAEQQRLAGVASAQRDEAEAQTKVAESEKEKALESLNVALLARSTAEGLINRMLYDLKFRLEPLGRVDLLDQVSTDAEAYFAGLPESHRTDASERERSTMLNSRGEVFMALGEWDRAGEAFEGGLEIRRERLDDSPDEPGRLRDVSVSQERIGDLLAVRGELKDSEKFYRESLAIREGLAAGESATAGRQRDLSVSRSKLSDVLARQERFDEALEFAAACENGFREANGAAVSSDEKRRAIRDLGAARMRRGDLHRALNQPEEALVCFQESAALLEGFLNEAELGDSTIFRDYGAVLMRLGEWQLESGLPGKALVQYRKALPIVRQLAALDPGNREASRNLALLLSRMGDSEAAAGEFAAAEALHRDSVGRFRELLKHPEPRPIWLDDAQAALIGWGDALAALMRWEEAHLRYAESLDLSRRREALAAAAGDSKINRVVSLFKTAMALRELGDPSRSGETRALLEEALDCLSDLEESEDEWIGVIKAEIEKLER